MYSLIFHGQRFVKLQNLSNLRASPVAQKAFSCCNSCFSSASDVTDVAHREGVKGKNFTVSYLVESLGLTKKLAESISTRVIFEDKCNPDSVLKLLRSHGFTDSQISNMVTNYPRLLIADAEKSLAPKLQFLQSRGASTSEFTEVVSKVPKILGKKGDITISRYYDFVKEIVEADKSSKFEKLCLSLPEGSRQENKFRNILVLRELGVPQRLLLPMLISYCPYICGTEKFQGALKKVVEMGFDPTSSTFVQALKVVYGLRDKTIEEKVDVFCKRLGFAVEDVWEMFKKNPNFLTFSDKNILNSMETFLGLGFSRNEFAMMVKCFPQCVEHSTEIVTKKIEFVVKKMNWPVTAVSLFPQVVSYSMEKRIVPRCKVIKALMSKGLLGDGGSECPSLSSVLSCTDQSFLKKYVMMHDDKELVRELTLIFTKYRAL